MQQRLPSLLDDPIVFAHRGARAYAPENTLASFRLALTLGVNGLESDVWVTADGEVVLDHDGVVRQRLRKSVPISTLRRDELPAHIPTLGELYEACGTGFHLSLDLKDEAAGRRVVDVTREAAPAMVERLWLCSPDYRTLLPLRDTGAKLVDSTRVQKMKEGAERRAATLAQEGIHAVNLHETDWNGGLVALFHRFDRIAFGWDMQEGHILERSFRMGLDAVFTDYPDRGVEAHHQQIGAITPIT